MCVSQFGGYTICFLYISKVLSASVWPFVSTLLRFWSLANLSSTISFICLPLCTSAFSVSAFVQNSILFWLCLPAWFPCPCLCGFASSWWAATTIKHVAMTLILNCRLLWGSFQNSHLDFLAKVSCRSESYHIKAYTANVEEPSDGAKFGTLQLAGLVLWSASRLVRCSCILTCHVLNFVLLDVLVLTSGLLVLDLSGFWRVCEYTVVGMRRK